MKAFKRIICTVTALAFMVSAFIFSCGFLFWVPRGVRVNGTNIGGMTYSGAYKLLRLKTEEELMGKCLRIYAADRIYDFIFPEIGYEEHFMSALKQAERGESIDAPVRYYLADEDGIISRICNACEFDAKDPEIIFNASGKPFTIVDGKDGRKVNVEKLKSDISHSLEGSFKAVYVAFNYFAPQLTEDEIAENTRLLSSFTTYFNSGAEERSHNIALAAKKLNGRMLAPGEVLSFNETVGARTAANGFKIAKIISGGKFVNGYGGGVCQVSTTLYNAALLAGLEIIEFHPHSLMVSYVPPSRDAMVSGSYFDLRVKNPSVQPVYIRATTSDGSITFSLYGRSDGYSYAFSSEVCAVIPSPDPVTIEGDEDRIISGAKEGAESVCYLIKKKDGKEQKILLRKDKYMSVAEVRQVKRGQSEEDKSAA